MRLIDADKLANKIAGHSNYHGDSILAVIYCMAEGKQVGDIKPIEAESVRHGKWEGLRCSECGRVSWSNTNYCQHCGAKMDGD